MCGMAAVQAMVTGCTSEQAESDTRRMAEQGTVVFQPSMALSTSWGQPGVDDWGSTRGLTTTNDVATIRFAGSRPMEAEVTRGARYEGNDVEGQSYQTLKISDTFRVSGYRYDPSAGETVSDVAEPNFFDNVEVSYDGEWRARDSYYIPTANDRTDFFAWFTPSGTEGVSLSSDKSGGLKLDYSVPSDVAKQPDLLTAVTRNKAYVNDDAEKVSLAFQHQLTEVNFVVGEELSPGTITEIAFLNVGMAGTLNVGDGTWAVTESPSETAFALNFQTFNNSGRRKGTKILSGLMMIPQTFSNANQRIRLKITIGDTPYTVYAGLSPEAGGAPQGWRAGEVVTYTISSSSLPQLKPNTLTVSSNEVTVKETKKKTVTLTANTSGGTVKAESADSTIAIATASGSTVGSTITIEGVAVGTTTIKVTAAERGEYAAASTTITVTVEEFSFDMGNAPSGCELVDFGIVVNGKSVLWSNMNVGATTVTGYGGYYAWGELATKRNYVWGTYTRLANGSNTTLKKYNNNSSYGIVDNKYTLETADDVAAQVWGGDWVMPTQAEYQALVSNTTRTWQTNYKGSGIKGCLFTGKGDYAGNSIFLPAGGYYYGTSVTSAGVICDYWLSSIKESDARVAYRMFFNSGTGIHEINYYERWIGFNVRPVQRK